jgi:DNA polymerase I
VHDELVFEVPPDEIDDVSRVVKQQMEGTGQLQVPLLVDVGIGVNWRDAK